MYLTSWSVTCSFLSGCSVFKIAVSHRGTSSGRRKNEKERSRRSRWRALHRARRAGSNRVRERDRKSTRLNSSHLVISYAVFCLKKKKMNTKALETYTV